MKFALWAFALLLGLSSGQGAWSETAGSNKILLKNLFPPYDVIEAMHSLPSQMAFETPRRHELDDLDQLQYNPKIQKAAKFYNKYFKVFDLDKATREGVYEVNIQAQL